MKQFSILVLFLIQLIRPGICSGQDHFIQWFSRVETQPDYTSLIIIANIRPGWHLYSQFIPDDGPMPTRLVFENSGSFQLRGPAEEKGNRLTYQDDIFGMEVTAFSDMMILRQNVELLKPIPDIKVTIVYMACNDTSCVPGKAELSIAIPPGK